MTVLVQSVVNALNLGSLYALYALGVAMIFGILKLINFAHASLITAGGYAMIFTDGLPLVVRLAVTVVVCILLAVLLVEQNATRAMEMADRTYVLRTGRIIRSGTTEELGGGGGMAADYLGDPLDRDGAEASA